MKFLFTILLLATQCFAQFGGVKAVDDTMRLENKFYKYKISAGDRMIASLSESDTLKINNFMSVPQLSSLSFSCDSSIYGFLLMTTNDNRLYFCGPSGWSKIAYDADRDGLTTAIDADDNVAFTAGNASASQVRSGHTFYTGSSMNYTSGTMTEVGAQVITPTSGSAINLTEGYHNGSGYITGDADLVASNIKSGVTIWGVAGSSAGSCPNLSSQTRYYSYTFSPCGYAGELGASMYKSGKTNGCPFGCSGADSGRDLWVSPRISVDNMGDTVNSLGSNLTLCIWNEEQYIIWKYGSSYRAVGSASFNWSNTNGWHWDSGSSSWQIIVCPKNLKNVFWYNPN